MIQEKAIIIGGGPCGLSAAIHLKQIGIDASSSKKAMSLTVFTITRRIKPFSVQVKSSKSEMWHLLQRTGSLSEFRLYRITGKSLNGKTSVLMRLKWCVK